MFLQIGDENVHLVRMLLDEVFGAQNFIAQVAGFKKTGGFSSGTLSLISDSILWYAKKKEGESGLQVKFRPLYLEKILTEGPGERYTESVELPDGNVRPISDEETMDPKNLPEGSRLLLGRTTDIRWRHEFTSATYV